MNWNMYKKTLPLLAPLCAGLALAPLPAMARNAPAMIAKTDPADASCWDHTFGFMRNTCSGYRTLSIPLAVDDSDEDFNVVVFGLAPNINSNIQCTATITSITGGASSTAWRAMSRIGSPGYIGQIIHTYPYGSLYTLCSVGPGATVYSIMWNEL